MSLAGQILKKLAACPEAGSHVGAIGSRVGDIGIVVIEPGDPRVA